MVSSLNFIQSAIKSYILPGEWYNLKYVFKRTLWLLYGERIGRIPPKKLEKQ